jgi:predicted transglutaminase-like cysteine proteinase
MTNEVRKTIYAILFSACGVVGAAQAQTIEPSTFVAVGASSRAPIGWVEFCQERPFECDTRPSRPRDAVLTPATWRELVRINDLVNSRIEPVTDQDQYGVAEHWTYPETGKGDCEDYVLLKRRLLMDAGWPREALLITVVRDKKGDGHAVLTVKTDRGEYVLDNQNEVIVPWTETGYRFIKRQSQSDPNAWVSIGEGRTRATATAR